MNTGQRNAMNDINRLKQSRGYKFGGDKPQRTAPTNKSGGMMGAAKRFMSRFRK